MGIRWPLFVGALVLAGCGGGGGNPGVCSGSPVYCAEHAAGQSSTGSSTGGTATAGESLTTAAFTRSGTGDAVIDLPAKVTRIRIEARYTGSSATFSAYMGDRLLVVEMLGSTHESTTLDGTYAVEDASRTLQIKFAGQVAWTVTEVVTGR